MENARPSRCDATTQFSPGEDAYSDYRNLRNEHQIAVAKLAELKNCLRTSGTLSGSAKELITHAEEALGREQLYFDGFLACIPLEHRNSGTAQPVIDQVFSTPELLENILRFLRLHDALTAQQVSKTFYHAIQDSIAIQKSLGFLPDYESFIRIPVSLPAPNIYFHIDDMTDELQLTDDNCVTLNGEIFNSVIKLPRLGSKSRKLLITQPPVKSLSIMADCCCDRFPPAALAGHASSLVTSEDGVTLGEVIDTAHRVAGEHRTCPNAPMFMHNEAGFVGCSLYMVSKITLQEGDPRLAKKRERRAKELAVTNQTSGLGARIGPYIAAKREARANGEPIPTLEEFERAQGLRSAE